MSTTRYVKILISLPLSIKQYLDNLKRLEGATVSGYIRHLLEVDREARIGSNWRPTDGWAQTETIAYRRRMAAAAQRAAQWADDLTLKRAQEIQARRSAQEKGQKASPGLATKKPRGKGHS